MKNATYFISDLHLDQSHPRLFELFYQFITKIQGQADSLYILGDLFDFWIGDNVIDAPAGKPYLPVINTLKALSDSGTNLFFIQGNRDFLAQVAFIERIGATLLPDQQVVDLYGKPTLIMHGDTLCTDDKGYQRMRWLFRRKLAQKIYLSLSPEKRLNQVKGVKKVAKNQTRQKNVKILDVNQQAVEKVMRQTGVLQLIHGHTHRPKSHTFELDKQTARRIVLGDWHDKACYLKVTPNEMKLVF